MTDDDAGGGGKNGDFWMTSFVTVQFVERWKHRRNDKKSMTAYHFID